MTNKEDFKNVASSAEKLLKESASTAEDMARKVWLAGLGAYGKSYEELTGRLGSIQADSNKLFDELVAKGTQLEEKGKGKAEEVKQSVVAKTDLESRIETVRSKLGLNNSDNEQKIEELSAKIDALTIAVAKLTEKPAEKPTRKKA